MQVGMKRVAPVLDFSGESNFSRARQNKFGRVCIGSKYDSVNF